MDSSKNSTPILRLLNLMFQILEIRADHRIHKILLIQHALPVENMVRKKKKKEQLKASPAIHLGLSLIRKTNK